MACYVIIFLLRVLCHKYLSMCMPMLIYFRACVTRSPYAKLSHIRSSDPTTQPILNNLYQDVLP